MPAENVSITAFYTSIEIILADTTCGSVYRQIVFNENGDTVAISGSNCVTIYNSTPGGSYTAKGQSIVGLGKSDLISISDDGNTIVIGDCCTDYNGTNSGHFTVYQWNSSTSQWSQLGSRIDGVGGGVQKSVAISGDGLVVAYGNPDYDVTTVYLDDINKGYIKVYEWNSTNSQWQQRGGDLIGESRDAGYGQHIALNEDGSRLLQLHDGTAKVFEWNGSNAYAQKGSDVTLSYSGSGGYTTSTKRCSLTSDGLKFAVCCGLSPNPLEARVFQWNSTNSDWSQIGSSFSSGTGVSLSDDGAILGVSDMYYDNYTGVVRVYKLINGSWNLEKEVIGEGDNTVKNNVSKFGISPDGSKLGVCFRYQEETRIFNLSPPIGY